MRAVAAPIALMAIMAFAAIVYAGEGFSMKCKSSACGYESRVIFGGGMHFQQVAGYCRPCKKFVYLRWTREGGPAGESKEAKVPPPKPVGEIVDVRTGSLLTIYSCPDCKGPFAEIKNAGDLKNCPACGKPGFGIDESKPRMAID